MDFKASVLSILYLICLSESSIVPTVEVLQGPSSKTVLAGPDGSLIDSAAPGGTVVTNDHGSGLVAAGPAVLPLEPELVVKGPAGSIATIYTQAGPAVVPAVAPAVLPVVAPVVVPAGADDNGDEGAYVPDKLEELHDDGSYKGER